jgi:hypothetical protein
VPGLELICMIVRQSYKKLGLMIAELPESAACLGAHIDEWHTHHLVKRSYIIGT